MQPEDITNRFTYHPPASPAVQASHESVRQAARQMAAEWNAQLPEGREKALAITKLEEAVMWANAAIARAGSGRS
ncbi:hypothetical protein ACIREM_32680 [Streptomyces shenzhenensis]|uniref:Acb2/Tad1 domain-containing protein n=1 Tax=Streptomyces shenzhenensis TaxID=943815 RepID=UPI00380BEC2B